MKYSILLFCVISTIFSYAQYPVNRPGAIQKQSIQEIRNGEFIMTGFPNQLKGLKPLDVLPSKQFTFVQKNELNEFMIKRVFFELTNPRAVAFEDNNLLQWLAIDWKGKWIFIKSKNFKYNNIAGQKMQWLEIENKKYLKSEVFNNHVFTGRADQKWNNIAVLTLMDLDEKIMILDHILLGYKYDYVTANSSELLIKDNLDLKEYSVVQTIKKTTYQNLINYSYTFQDNPFRFIPLLEINGKSIITDNSLTYSKPRIQEKKGKKVDPIVENIKELSCTPLFKEGQYLYDNGKFVFKNNK